MGNWNSCQRGFPDVLHRGHAKVSFNFQFTVRISENFQFTVLISAHFQFTNHSSFRFSIYPPHFRYNYVLLHKHRFQFTVRISIYQSHHIIIIVCYETRHHIASTKKQVPVVSIYQLLSSIISIYHTWFYDNRAFSASHDFTILNLKFLVNWNHHAW